MALLTICLSTAQPRKDSQSVKWVIDEVNRIISIDKGETRDLDQLRDLFLPYCRFMVVNPDPEASQPIEMVELDDFIELMKDPYYDQYEETSIGDIIEEYNGIAHAFQAFYGKDSEGDEARGINSIQLVYLGNKWWISSMLWTVESEDNPIPARYIQK